MSLLSSVGFFLLMSHLNSTSYYIKHAPICHGLLLFVSEESLINVFLLHSKAEASKLM